jgi:amidase
METLIRVMEVIDPSFGKDYQTLSVAHVLDRPRRVRRVIAEGDPIVLAAVDDALAACSWDTENVTLQGLEDAFCAALTVINLETWDAFGSLLLWGKIGLDVDKRLRLAEGVTSEQLAKAEAIRAAFTETVDAALVGVDALVLPTMSCFPPTIEAVRQGEPVIGMTSLARPFNLSGHPAISVPIPTSAGIKTGLQLIGRHGTDAALCVLGAELEQALQAKQFHTAFHE